ncbi:MAG: CBS domain-containing protein [Candidatus Krumholzibacteriota bacterium]|nr:CBS domain-containing protein [Candidatus Krumholzibacteriota bacterium]
MGERETKREQSVGEVQEFTRALLNDVRALEQMLEAGMFEKDVRRIGAEQEMFLVDGDLFPAPVSTEVLERMPGSNVGTELALFNLEFNATPRVFGGTCLSELEGELNDVIKRVRAAAAQSGADVILTGILPTLEQSHLGIENLTPNPRYHELNEALRSMRGGDFQIHIKGLDELQITHDNVLAEASSTSFQIHFQVAPDEFARLYNLAQAITAPVLAAAVNSPLFLGRRLWKETRVAVFQHSVDSRHEVHRLRGLQPRVDLGDSWVDSSVLEIIHKDIARFRVLLVKGIEEDSLAILDSGGIPRLQALCLHNSTVYRWNRFCYGITDGKAHLRIENRALPSGPSVVDEVSNAAFFFGLMAGLAEEHKDITRLMSFDDVRSNFYAVARHGLKAQIAWEHGRTYTAESLILKSLLPVAREGLRNAGIDTADIDRYLGVIERRVHYHRTGARWTLDSLATMGDQGTRDLRLRTVTRAMLEREKTGAPVHEWELASLDEAKDWRYSFLTVGQVMSTQLYTVRPEDLAEMVAHFMDWNNVRYVPVENDEGELVGLVTYRALIRLVGREGVGTVTVGDIMKTDLLTVTPETPTIEAVHTVRKHQVGCLPVVRDSRLLGILTMSDFLPLYDKLIDELLAEKSDDA